MDPDAVIALGVCTGLRTAGDILGLSKNDTYSLNEQGRFPVPVIKVGRRYMVPTAPLLELLHIKPRKTEHLPIYNKTGDVVGIVDPANILPIVLAGHIIPVSQPDGTAEWSERDDEAVALLSDGRFADSYWDEAPSVQEVGGEE